MHFQQQLPFEAGYIEFGHHDNLGGFADAQQVVQIGFYSQPLLDQTGAVIGTVSRPPIQRPVCAPLRTLSKQAVAKKAPVSGTAISPHKPVEVTLPSISQDRA
jgi:hypothetical protein